MPDIFGTSISAGGSGQAFAAIGAIYPAGATCTCSYGGKTITAKDTSGRALFLVPSAGQWLVKASNGGQEVEDTVSITTQGQVASVTLAFFSATIVCTFPVDCTAVTCTKDSTVLSVPSGSLSSGSYTFAIPEAGEWTLACTNGTDSDTATVNVTEEKAYNITLSFITYYYKLGDQCVDVTGGWEGTGNNNPKFNSNNVVVEPTVSNGVCTLATINKIDLTAIKTLHFELVCTTTGSYENSANCQAVGANGRNTIKPDTQRMTADVKVPEAAAYKDYPVDVSNLSGSYYLLASALSAERIWYAKLTISKIWGEPK